MYKVNDLIKGFKDINLRLPSKELVVTLSEKLYDAILWMFENDEELVLPKHNQELSTLLSTTCLNKIIDETLKKKIQFIYKTSLLVEAGRKVTDEQAQLCKLNFDDFAL